MYLVSLSYFTTAGLRHDELCLGNSANNHRTRGKYRATLIPLVTSNSSDAVESTTEEAFSLLLSDSSSADSASPIDAKDLAKALDILCKLRGIGPATASLIASLARPDAVPFFSDELFLWATGGQDAKTIKYTKKEYEVLRKAVDEVVERLRTGKDTDEVDASAVERAVWVGMIMKEEVGKGYVTGLQSEDRKISKDEKADRNEVSTEDGKITNANEVEMELKDEKGAEDAVKEQKQPKVSRSRVKVGTPGDSGPRRSQRGTKRSEDSKDPDSKAPSKRVKKN